MTLRPSALPVAGADYTLRQIEQMLGISPRVIAGLVRAGFVAPARGTRNEYRFSFQDVVLMRTAHALREARVPTRRILASLQTLRSALPAELPLSGLRITAVGDRVAVRGQDAQWEPETGQLVLDFEVAPTPDGVAVLPARTQGHREADAPSAPAAQALYIRAQQREATDAATARALYRQVLAMAPAHADASLNLGAMLCEAGRCAEAAEVYANALARGADEPLLNFNLAIALEDLGRPDEALHQYDLCLARSPGFADAHFNAARLHELLGHAQSALRHYSAYRRLQRT